ncbi:hypothetical protein [Lacticaseibacillus jixiensis]|uniref:hypothetical protein n=1 Tax=Lacticaseibacillus jixiensis TaxID=3231926 RepID=UPI0036F1DFE6
MQSFLSTVILTAALVVAFCLGLSWLNANTIQIVVNKRGKANSQLWLMKPGIFVHELLHAAVGRLFGLQVTQFSLQADTRSAAHVSFAYNRRSPKHQLGLFLASTAPLWGISIILVLLGKYAWYPGAAWSQVLRIAPAPNWPWVAIWGVVMVLLTFGASLSKQDLHNTLAALPLLIVIALVLYGVGWWVYPPLLSAWQQLNGMLAIGMAVMAGLALVVNRLCAWL